MSLFLTVEGVDGVGKSTQAELLARRLRARGHLVLVTREPGGTALGTEIRSLLLDRWDVPIFPEAEAYLYAADRAQHVREVIRPALAQGYIVISDRFLDSSLAYQGAAGLGWRLLERLNALAVDGLFPDVTFWLDRGDPLEAMDVDDRVERRGLEFQERVRQEFLRLWRRFPQRIVRIDARGTPEEVARRVWQALERRLGHHL
jgi:dTMP kinase